MQNISSINNAVVGNGVGDWGGGITIDSNQVVNIRVSNNLVSNNLSFQVVVDAGIPAAQVTINHNLIDGFRDYESETRGTNYVEGDPKFVNPTAADFRQQTLDSPQCRNSHGR